MNNPCVFSPDRQHRYALTHVIDDGLFAAEGYVAWICLNPSTADENKLDPTLRRLRAFTQAWGYGRFTILNLFAYRATLPVVMKRAVDPVGPENDAHILSVAGGAKMIVCTWGTHGWHLRRCAHVTAMLSHFPLRCLGKNADGSPRHPLYLPATTQPVEFL